VNFQPWTAERILSKNGKSLRSDCSGAITEVSLGELVRAYDLVELFFDGLPEVQIVAVFENKKGFRRLAELLHCLVQRMLPGIGVQALEELGGGGEFQPNGCDKAQKLVPLAFDDGFSDVRSGNSRWPNAS